MVGEVGGIAQKEATPAEQVERAVEAFNDVLIRVAQRGAAVKISVRSFPSVGRIARCPQVKAEVQEAK